MDQPPAYHQPPAEKRKGDKRKADYVVYDIDGNISVADVNAKYNIDTSKKPVEVFLMSPRGKGIVKFVKTSPDENFVVLDASENKINGTEDYIFFGYEPDTMKDLSLRSDGQNWFLVRN